MGIKSKFKKILTNFSELGGIIGLYKSIIFNLKNFPIKTALHMPVLISGKSRISGIRKGNIIIHGSPTLGVLRIGVHSHDFCTYKSTLAFIAGTLELMGDRIVVLESGCFMGIAQGCSVKINGSLYMNSGARLICHNHIEIGDNNVWQENTLIMDHETYIINDSQGRRINDTTPVKLGDNVWLQPYATVLGGVSIPENSIVKTGCIVTSETKHSSTNNNYKLAIFNCNPAKLFFSDGIQTRDINIKQHDSIDY